MSSRVAVDRMVVTRHRIDVPLDWNEPSGPQISVHAREVVAAEHADDTKRPAIVWFQGGPGHEVAFPDQRGSWLEQLLTRYRVLLLDQRGTGLSTPLEARALPFSDLGPGHEFAFPDQRGSGLEQLLTRYRVLLLDQRGTGLSTPLEARALPFSDPVALGDYLRHFRQDSIVRDADRLRATLYGEDSDWYVFGQSL